MRAVDALLILSLGGSVVWASCALLAQTPTAPDVGDERPAGALASSSLAPPLAAPEPPRSSAPSSLASAPGATNPGESDAVGRAQTALGRPLTEGEQQALKAFADVDAQSAPARFAGQIAARERAQREELARSIALEEDARHGGLGALLGRLDAREVQGPIHSLVDGKAFEAGFEPKAKGGRVPVSPGVRVPSDVASGDVVLFSPGSHAFDVSRYRSKRFPSDLVLEGYGVDVTLVRFDEFNDAEGPIVNVTFRDMTVDCGGSDYLFDVRRQEPVTLRFDRCRIVRHDKGSGSSCVFGVSRLAVWMTDTSIEDGYGSSPGSGRVFDVRSDALLARFERCRFVGTPIDYGRGGSVVLDRCRFEGLAEREAEELRSGSRYRLIEPTIVTIPDEQRREARKPKSLSTINQTWTETR